jgi:hypothetical protein
MQPKHICYFIIPISDYLFGWTYGTNDTLPVDTYMLCMWDNGTTHPNNEQFNLTNPLSVSPDQIYNIPHNFSSAGDYTLQCNMSNFVSSQKLEFNVSIIQNISGSNLPNIKFFFHTR